MRLSFVLRMQTAGPWKEMIFGFLTVPASQMLPVRDPASFLTVCHLTAACSHPFPEQHTGSSRAASGWRWPAVQGAGRRNRGHQRLDFRTSVAEQLPLKELLTILLRRSPSFLYRLTGSHSVSHLKSTHHRYVWDNILHGVASFCTSAGCLNLAGAPLPARASLSGRTVCGGILPCVFSLHCSAAR